MKTRAVFTNLKFMQVLVLWLWCSTSFVQVEAREKDATFQKLLKVLNRETSRHLDGCETMGFDGTCFGMSSVYGLVENAFCGGNPDSLECDVGKLVILPLIELVEGYATQGAGFPEGCMGDFETDEFATKEIMNAVGCPILPLREDRSYGVAAFKIPLPPVVQQVLTGMGLWKVPRANAITPTFCIAFQDPSCNGGLSFAMSFNWDTITALAEVSPNPEASTDSALAAVSHLAGEVIDTIAFGMSTNEDFIGRYKFITSNGWKMIDFAGNLFVTATGGLDVELLSVDGQVTYLLDVDFDTSGLRGLFQPSGGAAILDIIKSNSLATMATLEAEVTFGLSTLTSDLLPDLTFGVGAAMLKTDNLGTMFTGFGGGFYLTGNANAAEALDALCSQFEGVLGLLGAMSCPDFGNAEATFGIAVEGSKLSVAGNVPGFEVECHVTGLTSTSPTLKCQFGLAMFSIFQDIGGYVVSKLDDLASETSEEVARLSKTVVSKVGGFGKQAGGSLRSVAKSTLSAFRDLQNFFDGGSNKAREVSYGFKTKRDCKDDKTLLFDSSANFFWDDEGEFNDYNTKDRGTCFNLCYLKALEVLEADPSVNPDNFCCQYTKKGSGNERRLCQFNTRGRRQVSNSEKQASNSFYRDMLELINRKQVPEPCSDDGECISGKCHNNMCFSKCSSEDPCSSATEPYAWCNSDGDCEGSAVCRENECRISCSSSCPSTRWSRCDSNSMCQSNVCAYNLDTITTGRCVNKQENGATCVDGTMCESGFCHDGQCKTDCRSTVCESSSISYCDANAQCTSNVCFASACVDIQQSTYSAARGSDLYFGNSLIISASSSGFTSNCGWYGCRVLKRADDNNGLTFAHGKLDPHEFIIRPIPTGASVGEFNPSEDCVKWGDEFVLSWSTEIYDEDWYGDSIVHLNGNDLSLGPSFTKFKFVASSQTPNECIQFGDEVVLGMTSGGYIFSDLSGPTVSIVSSIADAKPFYLHGRKPKLGWHFQRNTHDEGLGQISKVGLGKACSSGMECKTGLCLQGNCFIDCRPENISCSFASDFTICETNSDCGDPTFCSNSKCTY